MCFRSPMWIALPDRSYERLGDGDTIYCGETEMRSGSEVVALCDYHQTFHWLGIYGDDELIAALESGQEDSIEEICRKRTGNPSKELSAPR